MDSLNSCISITLDTYKDPENPESCELIETTNPKIKKEEIMFVNQNFKDFGENSSNILV